MAKSRGVFLGGGRGWERVERQCIYNTLGVTLKKYIIELVMSGIVTRRGSREGNILNKQKITSPLEKLEFS